ncbi:unnamed protein product [Aureobasidium uvarum]|uniref:Hypervirulence associated protein TUDOR domain-containing protein n=1 Tax=Aureobasidium uvarum TaxID=2773716 RepID=A0A9N8PPV4_9PEZI|nr:unnamed protein product [Aureobasidium uvarum]
MSDKEIKEGDQGKCLVQTILRESRAACGPAIQRHAIVYATTYTPGCRVMLARQDIEFSTSLYSSSDLNVPVSWQWSGSRPGGKVAEIAKEGELSIETKNGNTVKKNADPEDPAVKISRSGNDVVKRAHELDVDKAGDKHKEDQGEEKTVTKDDKKDDDESKEKDGDKKEEADEEKKEDKEKKEEAKKESKKSDSKKSDGKAKTGDKREAKDDEEEKEDEEPSKKQQKTDEAGEENGDKKKRGRPAKNGNEASSSSKPKKEPKKAATESGEPRRSSRLK